MIEFRQILQYRNRGLLLDIAVFLCQLILIRVLTNLSLNFVRQAQQSVLAKTAIGIFLIALFLLQPLGPVLKRWSFHKHFPTFEKDLGALISLFLSFYKFFYIGSMAIMIYLAYSYFAEAFGSVSENATLIAPDSLEKIVVAAAIVLPIIGGVFVFRYFRKPEREPGLKFLMTPQAEVLGDLCMFLNIICFQILFSVYFSSPHFWNAMHKTTRLASGQLDRLSGRLYLAAIAAMIVYIPPRIFYLVPTSLPRRLLTWLFMLLANLPLIFSIVFYAPQPQVPAPLRQASFSVTAAEVHEEYKTNYQSAMRKYRGQYIDITGRVQTRFFPHDLQLNDTIGLDGNDGYPWAYCAFDEDQVESAEALEIGQAVTFQCVGGSDWSRGPSLEHCVVK
jgi:hypothetical protein